VFNWLRVDKNELWESLPGPTQYVIQKIRQAPFAVVPNIINWYNVLDWVVDTFDYLGAGKYCSTSREVVNYGGRKSLIVMSILNLM